MKINHSTQMDGTIPKGDTNTVQPIHNPTV